MNRLQTNTNLTWLAPVLMAVIGAALCRVTGHPALLLLLLTILNVALLSVAACLIQRGVRERARVEAALQARDETLQEQRAQLASTAAELTQANQMFQQVSQRFEALFQRLPVACFCYDREGRILEWNRAFETLFQVDGSTLLMRTIWDAVGRPDSREENERLIAGIFAGESFEGLRWEYRQSDGATRHILCNCFPLRSPGGEIVGGITIDVDVTAQTHVEQALSKEREFLGALLDNLQEGIVACDGEGRLSVFNRATRLFHGLPPQPLPPEQWATHFDLFLPDGRTPMRPQDVPLYRAWQGEAVRNAEMMIVPKVGPARTLLANGQAIYDAQGVKLGAVVAMHDVTERQRTEARLREANARLEALATTDGITGLKNRRAFGERLEQEFEAAQRYNTPLSVVMLDVDHFKAYNDRWGHQAGDEALRRLGELLKAEAREADLPARYGGEEFVIVLPHTDQDGARAMAERFRIAIAYAPGAPHPFTASLGIATRGLDTPDPSQLIAEADTALYASKEAGRNRATHYADLLPSLPRSPSPVA